MRSVRNAYFVAEFMRCTVRDSALFRALTAISDFHEWCVCIAEIALTRWVIVLFDRRCTFLVGVL